MGTSGVDTVVAGDDRKRVAVGTVARATQASTAAFPAAAVDARTLPNHQIPEELLQDAALNHAIQQLLPANYNFELHKTIWQMRRHGVTRVALQLPEGLQTFAVALASILEQFVVGARVVILGDVTYGACCVDDFTAVALQCDFLVHYGHSCLVPVTRTLLRTLYVFVEIVIDVEHVEALFRRFFLGGAPEGLVVRHVALVSTVQFIGAVHALRARLNALPASPVTFVVPQARPLSAGEVLGCTAPALPPGVDAVVYVGDGRFHLEAVMIANPHLQGRYFRYDPYAKRFSREGYDHVDMAERRLAAVAQARAASRVGLILGTLGRQGSPQVLAGLQALLASHGIPCAVFLMSEIRPEKLARIAGIDCWVQVACPRLSIDWGQHFHRPLLTPYELNVALRAVPWQPVYPMDFYARDSLGPWTPNHVPKRAV